MKIFINFLLWLLIALSANAFPKSQKSVEGLAGVYGYLIGQENSLKLIEKNFPELQQDVAIARLRFDATYSDAQGKTKRKLVELLNDDGVKLIATLEQRISEQLPKSLTKNEAVEFIKTVQNRANGVIENQPTRDFLLAITYFQQPENEFGAQKIQKFNTKNEEKAKGIELTVTLPLSWTERQGNTPNTVRSWMSEAGSGLSLISLLVQNSGDTRKKADIQKAIDKKDYTNMVPAKAIVNKIIYTEIANQPGWYVEMDLQQQRVDVEIFTSYRAINILSSGKTIQLSCSSGGLLANKDEVLNESKRNQNLCRLVMNSLVIDSLFK